MVANSLLKFLNIFQNFKMNFAQALRGPITRFGKIKEIYSAGETELGRKMTDVEFNSIITIFSLNNAYNYLQKVKKNCLNLFFVLLKLSVWIWNNSVFAFSFREAKFEVHFFAKPNTKRWKLFNTW
jgi:hypothetical protein